MIQKIRDKVKGIPDDWLPSQAHGVVYDEDTVKWLCATIEKLCDVAEIMEMYAGIDGEGKEELEALKEWEDKL